MSHEKTFTFEQSGRHYILPTIVGGKEYDPEDAIKLFNQGTLRPIGQFSTQIEADRFARKRSQESR